MSEYTHETVPTRFAEADGVRYAYRRFGKVGKRPILFLGYFNSNMDAWDPIVTNGLAKSYELILFDNTGVAASGGQTPPTVVEMTEDCFAFCQALGLKTIEIFGFSLGGMIAQQMALDHPNFVRRLILLGTGRRGGEGMTFAELSAEEQADSVTFPVIIGARRVAFVSADDGDAKKQVHALLEQFGYSVINLGNLRDGGLIQQAGAHSPAGIYLRKENIIHESNSTDRLRQSCPKLKNFRTFGATRPI